MYFKEKVVQLRKEAVMTQEFFAKEVGVSRQAVYKWEKGISYPEAEKLILIAKLFDVTIDSLLEDDFSLFEIRGLQLKSSEKTVKGKKKEKEAKKTAKKKENTVKKEEVAAPIEELSAVKNVEEIKMNATVQDSTVTEIAAKDPQVVKIIDEDKQFVDKERKILQQKATVKKQEKKPAGLFEGLRGIFSRRK